MGRCSPDQIGLAFSSVNRSPLMAPQTSATILPPALILDGRPLTQNLIFTFPRTSFAQVW